jgi:hypothetical protein
MEGDGKMASLKEAIEQITKNGGELGGVLCHPDDVEKFSEHGIPYITFEYLVKGHAFMIDKHTFARLSPDGLMSPDFSKEMERWKE